jgi:ribosomal protein L11 methyltransferase
MNYIEVCFGIKALESAEINAEMAREILVAELGVLNFESFVNTKDGLQAYVQEEVFDEEVVKDLYILQNPDFAIEMEVKTIEQQNWNAEWEKNFDPIEVDGRCVVRAPFHEKKEVDFDIVIEPKMSFGTGHHETTHQMIAHLLDMDVSGKRVLDMGCGTGILAILACMNGAASITGVDIDEWAYRNTLENVRNNKCSQIIVKQGGAELLENHAYDVILANINRNILLNDMEAYVKTMSSGSKIVFSGFYTSDINHIDQKARSLGMRLLRQSEKNNWVALVYQMG